MSAGWKHGSTLPDSVEAMVAIDHGWDNLKLIHQSGWKAPATQPDLAAAREALLLQELYRELARKAAAPSASWLLA